MAASLLRKLGNQVSPAAGNATLTVGAGGAAVGDSVLVAVVNEIGNLPTSITDSKGNTYLTAVTHNTNNTVAIYYCAALTVALVAGDTIQTTGLTTGQTIISAYDYAGILSSPLDKTAGNNGSGTAATSGTTAATTQADELAFAVFGTGANPANFSAGGAYTLLDNIVGSIAAMGVEHLVLSATGTQSASMTQSVSQTWEGVIATFKATAAGAPPDTSGRRAAIQAWGNRALRWRLPRRRVYMQTAAAAIAPVTDTGNDQLTVTPVGAETVVDQAAVQATVTPTAVEVIFDSGVCTVSFAPASSETVIDQGTIQATAAALAAVEAPADTGSTAATFTLTGAEAAADAGTVTATGTGTVSGETIIDQATVTVAATPTAAEQIRDQGTIVATGTASAAVEAPADAGTGTAAWTLTGAETVADAATAASTATPSGTEQTQEANAVTVTVTPAAQAETVVDQAVVQATVTPSGTGNVFSGNQDAGTVTVTFTPSAGEIVLEANTSTATIAATAAEQIVDQGVVQVTGTPGAVLEAKAETGTVTALITQGGNLLGTGFENGTLNGWGNASGTGTQTLTIDATQAHTGSRSLKVVTGGTAASEGASSATVQIVPGGTYQAAVWLFSVAGGEAVSVLLVERDVNSTFLGSTQTNVVLVAGWQQVAVTRTMNQPAGTNANVKVQVNGTAAITFWLDDPDLHDTAMNAAGTIIDQGAVTATATPAGGELATATGTGQIAYTPSGVEKVIDQAAATVTVTPTGVGFAGSAQTDAGTVTVTFTAAGVGLVVAVAFGSPVGTVTTPGPVQGLLVAGRDATGALDSILADGDATQPGRATAAVSSDAAEAAVTQ